MCVACAAVGNADAAFQIQAEMEREGFSVDKQCATSLINACSKELLHTSEHQRRQRLVLLERAGKFSFHLPCMIELNSIEAIVEAHAPDHAFSRLFP